MNLSVVYKHKLMYGLIFLGFLLSFNLNVFGVGLNAQWFDGFDPSSEQMIHRTIHCAAMGDYKGNITNLGNDPFCKAYPSQFGLQGYVYGNIAKVFPGEKQQHYIIQISQFVLTIFLAILLLLFVAFAHHRYGKAVAVLVASMLMTSVWLVGYSNQMYWVTFVFFMPFVMSLYIYPLVRDNNKKLLVFYLALGFLFLIKFLNGYEYIVASALSAVAPVLYWEMTIAKKFKFKLIARRSASIILASVVGFVVAISMHAISLVNDYGSLSGAINAIKGRGEARSAAKIEDAYPVSIYNFIDMQPEIYQLIDKHKDVDALYDGKHHPAIYFAIMIVSYLLIPVITLPLQFNGLISVIVESFFFWVIIAFLAINWLKRKKILAKHESKLFIYLLIMGLIGIISWHVLFTEHVFVHAHMVGISYYMPTMLWVYLIISIAIVRLFSRK